MNRTRWRAMYPPQRALRGEEAGACILALRAGITGTVVEELLGIRLRSGALELEPRLPSGWHGYSATLTLDGAVIAITVSDTAPQGLTVDGEQAERFTPDGREHRLVYGIGASAS